MVTEPGETTSGAKFTLINENTMQKPVELIQPLKIQLDFDSWWLITQNRLKLKFV